MDIDKISRQLNIVREEITGYTHTHGRTAMGIIAGISIFAGPVSTYRGLYTWSDTLFQKVTLEQVNKILSNPQITNNFPPDSRCDYTEGKGGNGSLICNGHTMNFTRSLDNTTLYKCFDIQLDKNKQLNTSSGYCFRGSIKNGEVVYHDKAGNILDPNFIPGKYYPLPITANQG